MESVLPITVISAVILFIIKEVLEMIKKAKAKKRKLNALKVVLKEEIELNFWTWKKLESLLTNVRESKEGSTFEHLISPSGTERFQLLSPEGYGKGQAFPKVVNDLHSKLVIDVAESDENMYQKLIVSFKSLSELQHLRNGIVDFIHDSNMAHGYSEVFTSDALEELARIYNDLDALYQYCAGKKLTEHRMR